MDKFRVDIALESFREIEVQRVHLSAFGNASSYGVNVVYELQVIRSVREKSKLIFAYELIHGAVIQD